MILDQGPLEYRTADLRPGAAQTVTDITDTGFPDAAFDLILCSHVLEHVDDRAALHEFGRILRPGGEAVLMVPIAEGWPETFEDETISSWPDCRRYYDQLNHVRYYGADFRDRVRDAGFALAEFVADGRQCGDMGLIRGERVFLATKPKGNQSGSSAFGKPPQAES